MLKYKLNISQMNIDKAEITTILFELLKLNHNTQGLTSAAVPDQCSDVPAASPRIRADVLKVQIIWRSRCCGSPDVVEVQML